MTRKDTILNSFLSHPIIKENYDVQEPLPESVAEALLSDIPIIKAIALIVENMEVSTPITDGSLRILINQYLNTAAL